MITAIVTELSGGYVVIDAKSGKVYTDGHVFATKGEAIKYVQLKNPDIIVF